MGVLPFAVLGHVEGILSCHTEMAGWKINELGGLFFDAKFMFEACHLQDVKSSQR